MLKLASKVFIFFTIFFLLSLYQFIEAKIQKNEVCKIVNSKSNNDHRDDFIKLEIVKIFKKGTGVEINFTIKNNTTNDMFILTNPTDVNGKKQWHTYLSKSKASELTFSSLLFRNNRGVSFYTDSSGSDLELLRKGAFIQINLQIPLPITTSFPPFDNPIPPVIINDEVIENIKIEVGVFDDFDGVSDVIQRKVIGKKVGGFEQIRAGKNSGKSLFETQIVISETASFKIK